MQDKAKLQQQTSCVFIPNPMSLKMKSQQTHIQNVAY